MRLPGRMRPRRAARVIGVAPSVPRPSTTTELALIRVFLGGTQVEELMRVALVVIIVVAWVVILIPGFLRRRSAGNATDSISHFHQQLRILEHSAPKPIVAPAYRLRVDGDDGRRGRCRGTRWWPPTLTVVGARDLPRPALAFLADPLDDPGLADPRRRPMSATIGRRAGSPLDVGQRADGAARRLTRQRRRDTLGVLILVVLASFMIGFVPGASVAWVATGIFGIALAAYVAQLVHLRRLAEERERKLHYLRPPLPGALAGLAELGALVEGDAGWPRNVRRPLTIHRRSSGPAALAALPRQPSSVPTTDTKETISPG